jgi:hypothetical protein
MQFLLIYFLAAVGYGLGDLSGRYSYGKDASVGESLLVGFFWPVDAARTIYRIFNEK